MRRVLIGMLAIAAGCGMSARAEADPIVPGSTYGALIFDGQTNPILSSVFTFDGAAETRTLANGTKVTVNETQTALGFGVLITADGPMFTGLGGSAFYGLGKLGDPMNLAFPYHVLSAFLTIRDRFGSVQTSGDFADLLIHPDPWDGIFVGPGFSGGFAGLDSPDTRSVEFEFSGVPVPEPGTLTLFGLGAAVGSIAFRRKSRAARAAQVF